MSETPRIPRAWQGRFLARYPDGHESDFDTRGTMIRVGEQIGDTGWILDRFEVSEVIVEGKPMLRGYLRPLESPLSDEDKGRLHSARAEARAMDYILFVESDETEPVTWHAFAALALPRQATMARWLASAASAGDAAEAGVDTLKGIVHGGGEWPERPSS